MDNSNLQAAQPQLAESLNPVLTDQFNSFMNIAEFPHELGLKILLNLDSLTFWKISLLVSKKFKTSCGKLFLDFHLNLDEKFMIQPPTTIFSEITRITKMIAISVNIDDMSKKMETLGSKNLYPPQEISHWPDETPIPEDFYVFVFTDNVSEKITCENIHSVAILPKIYPKNKSHIQRNRFILNQKLSALKRLAFLNTLFDNEFLESMENVNLNLLFISNCALGSSIMNPSYENLKEIFHTKILYFDPGMNRQFSLAFSNLENLYIFYRESSPKIDPTYSSYINLSECSSLKHM